MLRLYSVILSAFLGACPLVAQDIENGQEKEPRGRLAWIVAVAIPDDLENPVKMVSGKKVVEVTLSKRSVGEPVQIPKEGIVRMIRELPNADDPEKPIIETLAQAQIPETVTNALVILVPVKKKEGSTLLFASTVQNLAGFGGGETLYMNLSPREILVQLGDEKIPLRKGDIKVTKSPKQDKAVNKEVSYSFFDPAKEKWKLLGASTVVVRPTRREICIFSWDSRFDRLDYHGVTFPVAN